MATNEEKSTEAIKIEELNISRYLLLNNTKPNYVDGVHTEKIYWEWPLQTGNTPEDIYKNDLEDSKWINKDDINLKITAIGMQAREPEVIDVVLNNGKRYSSEIKGKQLKNVAFNTTEDTTSIMDAINGIKYADGWHYVSGNDIEGMQLENSYIVNYETGEKGILYINGIKTKITNRGIIKNLVDVQYEANIQIGSDIYSTYGQNNNYPFNGEIYAARVYNRPLTAKEVTYNYNNTVNANH